MPTDYHHGVRVIKIPDDYPIETAVFRQKSQVLPADVMTTKGESGTTITHDVLDATQE